MSASPRLQIRHYINVPIQKINYILYIFGNDCCNESRPTVVAFYSQP